MPWYTNKKSKQHDERPITHAALKEIHNIYKIHVWWAGLRSQGHLITFRTMGLSAPIHCCIHLLTVPPVGHTAIMYKVFCHKFATLVWIKLCPYQDKGLSPKEILYPAPTHSWPPQSSQPRFLSIVSSASPIPLFAWSISTITCASATSYFELQFGL